MKKYRVVASRSPRAFWYARYVGSSPASDIRHPRAETQTMRIDFPRLRARSRLRPVILAILCGVFPTTSYAADEPPKPPTGEVRLESGRVVDYTVHFDRNSLQDSLRVGDGLIALTTSGALLRFELPEVRLVRERVTAEETTCLGRGEGKTVLAGFTDGRVCRVDPTTLELADVVKLSAAPKWIGWGAAVRGRPAGLVVVTQPTKPVDRGGRHWDVPFSVVNDLATGKTFALEEKATAFLLDGAGRVWLGADKGEWGGRITRVDLVKGTLVALKPPPSRDPDSKAFWDGVYGIIELRDGQVWAFGGTSHMGFNEAYVTRIDEAEPHPLFSFAGLLPITHIVEEDGHLLVFSYSNVFRVDKALRCWDREATLAIESREGRPDAVGSYPSVQAVHPPTKKGEPYVVATVGDGYVLLEGLRTTTAALLGQLQASSVARIMNTSEGTLFLEDNDEQSVWHVGEDGWEIAALAPPLESDPPKDAPAFDEDFEVWSETRVLVAPDGAIYTVSGTDASPGTRITGRRVNGESVRIGREESSVIPSTSFLTADGTLWNASFGELTRFERGRWRVASKLPQGKSPSDLRPLNTNGPPWLLLDDRVHDLWRLEHGAQKENPQLTKVDVREDGKPLRIDDAIPWSDGSLLLATSLGLRAFDPLTAKLSRVDLPEPPKPATRLARDRLGRLWLGGKNGLWMVEPKGKTLEAFDRVPWLGRNEVSALAPDPKRDDGMIVALGSRGIVFVRARPKP